MDHKAHPDLQGKRPLAVNPAPLALKAPLGLKGLLDLWDLRGSQATKDRRGHKEL
jgi:hypothetical protein